MVEICIWPHLAVKGLVNIRFQGPKIWNWRRHVTICRRRNILKNFFDANGRVFQKVLLSLYNNKTSFSSAVDHVFRFAFVGVLIIL